MAGPSGRRKLVAALSYAASSVLIMVVNKMVLTAWKFPSAKCLALGQFCFASLTILVLSSGPVGMLKVRGCDRRIARQIGPFALLIPANVVSGLMGTRALNLAMFSALRRMSIIMTMILEWAVLRTKPSPGTAAAVFLMIIGAVVAASDDLAFDAHGYMVVFLNNACTAALGVQTKWSLKSGSSSSSSAAAAAGGGGGGGGGGAAAAAVAVGAVGAAASKGDSSKLTKFELLYYQSICAIPVLVAVLVFLRPHELEAAAAFEHWTDPSFAVSFCLSLVLGLLLNYASAFCTQVNSALTTTVVGCCKNVIVAYLSIGGLGGDYQFSAYNFLGLNISIVGSLIFSFSKLREGGGRGSGGRRVKGGGAGAGGKDAAGAAGAANPRASTVAPLRAGGGAAGVAQGGGGGGARDE